MDHIYAATISLSESRAGGTVGITLLCGDCNGTNCLAQAQFDVKPLDAPALPLEWLVASLGALADTAEEFEWTFQHDAECVEADQ